MPIITKAGSPVKGSPTEFTLDKAELLTLISDPYFLDTDNWKTVSLIYKSSEGNQSSITKFKADQTFPAANFAVSLKAKDVFQIHKIVIKDFDNGSLEILRPALITAGIVADFDVDMTPAPSYIEAVGTLDSAFCIAAVDSKINPGSYYSQTTTTAVQSDGKTLIGGAFLNYGGTSGRNKLVRLNSDGTVDSSFCANAVDGNKFGLYNFINKIIVQPDGKILVAGYFTNYAGTTDRNCLIRLNSDGTPDTSFCNNASDGDKFVGSPIFDIDLGSNGKIVVCGDYYNYGGVEGRRHLVRLNSDGTLDTSFCSNAADGHKFNDIPYSVAIQSDGKTLVGGVFTSYNSEVGRDKLIRLNSDGTLDTAFCNNASDTSKFNNDIRVVRVQSSGKILVGGLFTNYAGSTGQDRLIRFNLDGTVDASFSSNAVNGGNFNNTVYSIFSQQNNKILVGGSFMDYAGTFGRNKFIRLNSDGTVDSSFCSNAVEVGKFNNAVFGIYEKDGSVFAMGSFTNYADTSGRSYLVKFL